MKSRYVDNDTAPSRDLERSRFTHLVSDDERSVLGAILRNVKYLSQYNDDSLKPQSSHNHHLRLETSSRFHIMYCPNENSVIRMGALTLLQNAYAVTRLSLGISPYSWGLDYVW